MELEVHLEMLLQQQQQQERAQLHDALGVVVAAGAAPSSGAFA